MRALLRGAATLAVVAAVSLSPAMAQGPRPSSSSQEGFLSLPVDPSAANTIPHYEWQYHYAGRHARWRGYWVPVEPPASSAPSAGAGGKL